MRSAHRWPLFRICLAGLMGRGSCWLLLLGLPVVVWLAPLLTPWQENPQILQPARAQAAWMYAWLALFTWLPFQGAVLGHRLRQEGLLEHLRAGGRGAANLCLQLASSILVWMVVVAIMAFVVCVPFCLPENPEQAKLWTILTSQYWALYVLVGAPLIVLAVALGSRTAEILAFLLPVGLLFTGLFGAVWLAPLLGGSSAPALKALWLAIPHYHLADLTPRLVFKMGPLTTTDFLAAAGILSLQGFAICLLARWVFRTRS
jgi:hypothetical protein